jgi:hypothetical protein
VSEHDNDPFIEQIAGELRRPVRIDSSFESRVMAAIDPSILARPNKRGGSTSWLLRPRAYYFSPLAGLAVAAGIVALVTMSVLRTQPTATIVENPDDVGPAIGGPHITPVAFDSAAPLLVARPFTYINPNAKSVAVVGNFNDWDASRGGLTLTSDGLWSGNIMLAPGRYEYQLVVDGKWMPDPSAQHSAKSEFGGTNSVVIVSPVPR